MVTDAGTGNYAQRNTSGRHLLIADELVSIGGTDSGPNPYERRLAALGARTSMTLRMYPIAKACPSTARPSASVTTTSTSTDCEPAEQQSGMLSRIRREIDIEGPLNDQDRRRLVEIADRFPVHRTLSSEIAFETTGT